MSYWLGLMKGFGEAQEKHNLLTLQQESERRRNMSDLYEKIAMDPRTRDEARPDFISRAYRTRAHPYNKKFPKDLEPAEDLFTLFPESKASPHLPSSTSKPYQGVQGLPSGAGQEEVATPPPPPPGRVSIFRTPEEEDEREAQSYARKQSLTQSAVQDYELARIRARSAAIGNQTTGAAGSIPGHAVTLPTDAFGNPIDKNSRYRGMKDKMGNIVQVYPEAEPRFNPTQDQQATLYEDVAHELFGDAPENLTHEQRRIVAVTARDHWLPKTSSSFGIDPLRGTVEHRTALVPRPGSMAGQTGSAPRQQAQQPQLRQVGYQGGIPPAPDQPPQRFGVPGGPAPEPEFGPAAAPALPPPSPSGARRVATATRGPKGVQAEIAEAAQTGAKSGGATGIAPVRLGSANSYQEEIARIPVPTDPDGILIHNIGRDLATGQRSYKDLTPFQQQVGSEWLRKHGLVALDDKDIEGLEYLYRVRESMNILRTLIDGALKADPRDLKQFDAAWGALNSFRMAEAGDIARAVMAERGVMTEGDIARATALIPSFWKTKFPLTRQQMFVNYIILKKMVQNRFDAIGSARRIPGSTNPVSQPVETSELGLHYVPWEKLYAEAQREFEFANGDRKVLGQVAKPTPPPK